MNHALVTLISHERSDWF